MSGAPLFSEEFEKLFTKVPDICHRPEEERRSF